MTPALTQGAQEVFRLDGVSKVFPLARSALARLFDRRSRTALADIELGISRHEVVGVCGESGSGKTTVARLMVGLDQPSAGRITFEGKALDAFAGPDWTSFRRKVQMVFQGTHTALNPRKTVARALREARALDPQAGSGRSLAELMTMVRLPTALAGRLPHELSGGQRQRVGIARALARDPEILILDEPTSALDVSVQREIVALLGELRRSAKLTLVVISHDLGMLAGLCERIIVMYGGRVVESGPASAVLLRPSHPYTRQLIDAVPRGLAGRSRRPPALLATGLPTHAGCAYEPRCPACLPVCSTTAPALEPRGDVAVRCLRSREELDPIMGASS